MIMLLYPIVDIPASERAACHTRSCDRGITGRYDEDGSPAGGVHEYPRAVQGIPGPGACDPPRRQGCEVEEHTRGNLPAGRDRVCCYECCG